MARCARVLGAVLLTAGIALTGLPPAAAAGDGYLRLAHLSPDTPAVDVAVAPAGEPTAAITGAQLGYGEVSEYRPLPPGRYAVSVRTAGGDPATPPVLSTTVELPAAGDARTVAATGSFAGLQLAVLDDDRTPPPAGMARVRVVAAAATVPALDATVPGRPPLASGLAFPGAGDYEPVPAGATVLRVTGDGTATEVPLDLAAGSVYSLLVLDRPGGGLAVRPLVDAVGAAVVPGGGVEAGAGGTAGDGRLPTAVAGAGLLVAAAVLVLTLRRSRR
ncbi:DUF4397 domain-containing protein [Geodermatophilus ruber]|uniref:DUF4397 domain-containing protein n=1 Tax=Geodermatophilus ruber TaxID=504800 RepID=A0A1I4IA85_9ACTN|nr:DUF4397 domain-containing protein [Geodermatophilus ruber]SFL51288.1 protein of unknown function [Geodermatophilus ruber]